MKNRPAHRHTASQPIFRRVCALILALTTAVAPTLSSAAGLFPGLIGRTALPYVPPAGTLPELRQLYGGVAVATDANAMTITQNQGKERVVIDWSSFNIGSGAQVRFYQGTGTPGGADWKPNSKYAALNRIYDLNPSVIHGNLQADGRVYLINRNGVFFGPGSKVQVQSLVASAFNITNADFENGRLIFRSDPYDPSQTSPVADTTTISNEGSITTNSGGSVFFVGPRVQNIGSISAPGGKIDLVGLKANGQVEIKEVQESSGKPTDVVYTDTALAGDVANMGGGSLHGADGAWIGLYGNTVRNDGLIRAVTTRRQNGVVYLSARDLAATGAGSVTDVEVSDASEAMGRTSLAFSPGVVAFGGLYGQGINALSRIDHEGAITAHSGNVRMEAVERVFLGGKSSIDVSGITISRPMSDQFIEAQLNSLYLRDDYGQKYGTLLPGSTVTIDVLKGSSVGNISTYYLGMTKSARDLSTVGGNITIGAPVIGLPGSTSQNYTLMDIVISKGAGFNLSGGKATYSGSVAASSKVLGSNGQVYDMSSMPQWLSYTSILGENQKHYGKYGNETLKGVSFGGHLLPLQSNPADRIVGGNAGSLTFRSRVINGLDDDFNLQASVTSGLYQTVTTPYLDSDMSAAKDSPEYQRYIDYLVSLNRGLEAPRGGKVVIGNKVLNTLGSQVGFQEDAAVSSIAVRKSFVSAAPVTGWDGVPAGIDSQTEISATMLGRVGLGSLALYANTSISTDRDAGISLLPGGNYNATARRIEFLGAVSTPGGTVEMLIRPNISSYDTPLNNPLYRQVAETIYLGGGSRIDTSGERIDDSRFGLLPQDMRKGAFTAGGSISLTQVSPTGVNGYALNQNNENSIVIKDGALLDVSGGYRIDEKGAVSGGNAGILTVKAPTISLGGELRGFALPGKDGGGIVLHAREVRIAGEGRQFSAGFGINDTIDQDLVGKLVVGADRFRNGGFSRVDLSATDNLTVADGIQLSYSPLKSVIPDKTTQTAATCSAGECFSTAYPAFLDQVGKSSLSLSAGRNVYDAANVDPSGNAVLTNLQARLTIADGAGVIAAPGGAVSLAAPIIDIAGTVSAPGGSVAARSTVTSGSITLRSSGRILATGYNKTGIAAASDQPPPLPVPKAGGTVSLEASKGILVLENGSLVDVSGSESIEGVVREADRQLTPIAVAGDAGSLSLAYAGGLLLDGTIAGAGKMSGTRNGSMAIKSLAGDLTINAGDVDRYQNSGFDDLTFSSPSRIVIPANINLSAGRSLTLDSPILQGTGTAGDVATIRAPWVKLFNTGGFAAPSPGTAAESGRGAVSFIGGYLDLKGSLLLDGFSQVNLVAERDLTFTDRTYTDPANKTAWVGALGTAAASLTLQASRIYPTTASNFTITTPGTATILPGAVQDASPVYSAGGSLAISAAGGIDHRGFLAAPQGGITLDSGPGRIDLAEGSITTTTGSAPVAYGTYDSSNWWVKYLGIDNTGKEVTAAPAKSITLKGKEVVVRDGATQDLSGGGSVYVSYWQPGIAGTNNPLTVSGRYVIMPDGSASRPGDSVYLEAMPELGLKAGIYSILPAEFAFVPGALVLQDTGKQLLPGQQSLSKEVYPVVGGYLTVRDTAVASKVFKGFSVRRAEDVLREGDFTVRRFDGEDGGNFTLNASGGAYFGGAVKMNPVDGYRAGIASLAARNVEIVASASRPDFSQPLSDTLQLSGDRLSGLPVRELRIGDKDTTTAVTVFGGVSLKAASVTLSARDAVTLEAGALVEATGSGTGDYASIVTPTGTFALGDGAQLRAASGIKLDVKDTLLNPDGIMDAGVDGYFSLTTNRIIFDDALMGTADGSYHMTGIREDTFRKYRNLTIASRGDMEFQRDVDLITGGSMTLDAARYLITTGLDTTSVSFTSKDLTLLNSGTTFAPAATGTGALSGTGGSLSFNAENITVAPRSDGSKGNIAFDRFDTVNINSTNELVLKGEGTVATMGTGDLNLSAARVTTASDTYKADSSYTVPKITIDGRSGAVTLNGSASGIAGTGSTPGGSLQILGDSITQNSGLIDVAAGRIVLAANGDIAINGSIQATGSEHTAASGEKMYYSGGRITLQSDAGKVDLQNGASLDVSAVAQGDAGSVVLSATTSGMGGVVKAATTQVAGRAGTGGKGGSLSIDSASLAGIGGLDGVSGTLTGGGFTERINIRSRSGDLALTAGTALTGREVVIAADGGAIAVAGAINADTYDGSGRIELYSGTALTLQAGSALSARGTAMNSTGGTVILSSQDGSDNSRIFNGSYALNVASGSAIDVAGNGGTGGTVAFRAYQGKKQSGDATLNDVNMGTVNGAINGASRVSVEAVRAYADKTTVGALTGYVSDATTFMTAASGAATKGRLFATNNPVNHLQAGIEISSAANTDLTFDTAWDLKSVRPGGETGVVTLKSARNLTINQSLSDAPTSLASIRQSTLQDSWGINLIAGSDGGSNFRGVNKGNALAGSTGNLVIAGGKVVYSEKAPLNFAAGNDTTLNGWTSTPGPGFMVNVDMKYNMGSYGGAIRGEAGRDLNLTATGSAIQSALGDIDIRTGRDLNLGNFANTGAIRTTGEFDDSVLTSKQPGLTADTSANRKSYWTYHNGGGIDLDVGNSVNGNLSSTNGWDGAYVDSSLYTYISDNNGSPKIQSIFYPWYLTAGFGGSMERGQSVNIPVTVGIATMGGGDISVSSGGTLLAQIGAFGRSSRDTLTISSSGNMSGRFRVKNGSAKLTAGGAFGTIASPVIAELGDAQVRIAAMGDIRLGSVLNPDNSRDRLFFGTQNQLFWNMTYTQQTAFSAASLAGNAILSGTSQYAAYSLPSGVYSSRKFILPASFDLSAARDVTVANTFVLSPSEKGNLGLFAGGGIHGVLDSNGAMISGFKMQDVDIATMYGLQVDKGGNVHYSLLSGVIHRGINHLNDTVSVRLRAGKDISNLNLYLNKPAEVIANGNITRLNYTGQNTSPDSVTIIKAGGNIDQGITVNGNKPTIEVGGPGTLLVQAGGNISLGNSGGINSVGNTFNGSFSGTARETDSDLIVSAGAFDGSSMSKQDVQAFFEVIRDASDQLARLKVAGKTSEADRLLADTENVINTYFYTYDAGKAGLGNLDMVDSAISSRSGSIYAMAGSRMNVGKTALSNAPMKSSGITTLYGGKLSIYAGSNINVNESRIMTYLGGDITVWSDQGDINAGRGSKTVVSAPTPVYNYDPANPDVLTSITFTPPSAGSGIRALTFDPDGSGPVAPPAAGNIYIHAKGFLDAGEAGIVGGAVFIDPGLGVLNAANIVGGTGSVGVPSSSQNTVSIGPMTGASDMTSDRKMIETISGGGEAAKKTILAEAEDFLMKYLDVKVIDLSEGTL